MLTSSWNSVEEFGRRQCLLVFIPFENRVESTTSYSHPPFFTSLFLFLFLVPTNNSAA
jgi:hypothetical protein